MGANALGVLFNHTAPRGQMYSFATTAAVSAWAAHYVYSAIREGERLRQLRSSGATQLIGTGEAPDAPWLHTAAMRPSHAALAAARIERDCPFCAEPILTAARLCKHCHSDVSATAIG